QAARDEQHLGGRHEHGLDETEQGDDGRFAGLPTAVEQQARVAGFEDFDLPGVGLQTQVTHHLDGGRAGGMQGHGRNLYGVDTANRQLYNSSNGVEGGNCSRNGANHASRSRSASSGGTVSDNVWPRNNQ